MSLPVEVVITDCTKSISYIELSSSTNPRYAIKMLSLSRWVVSSNWIENSVILNFSQSVFPTCSDIFLILRDTELLLRGTADSMLALQPATVVTISFAVGRMRASPIECDLATTKYCMTQYLIGFSSSVTVQQYLLLIALHTDFLFS